MAQIKTKLAYGVSGTLATANIADDAVTAAKIADNAVVTAAINADAVTDAKIADDVVGTEHLTAGEVDTTALGADSVNATKIADDSISDEHLDITAITGQTAITSLADTDKFLVSDASDSGNLKYVEKQYLPSGKMVLLQSASTQTNAGSIVFDGVFDKDLYSFYKLMGWFRPATAGTTMQFRWRSSSADLDASTYYGVTHGKAINGGGQADVSWDRWGGNYAKVLADMKNLAYNGATIDMLLRPRFASGTSTQSVASMNFRAGFWDNNSGSERSIVVNGACSYTSTSADMDNGGFVLFQSSGQYDEFEYVLYGVTQS